jgi:secondary thiamine-phosphate synthase enzyme
MGTKHYDLELATRSRSELLPVTAAVARAVRDAGVEEGLCLVTVPHTTAGILVNENADPDVAADILGWLDGLVPPGRAFRHAEGNADAHIKAVLTGSSVSLPIRGGELALGTWQGIFFAEFDGPRKRRIGVTCAGDEAEA